MVALERDKLPRAVVVRVRSDIDVTVTPALRRTLGEAVDQSTHVIVDLAEAPTMDSTGLAVLVRAHCRARRQDGNVCLVAPSRYVVTVLHTMKVDGCFPMFADCASALQWLGASDVPAAPMFPVLPSPRS